MTEEKNQKPKEHEDNQAEAVASPEDTSTEEEQPQMSAEMESMKKQLAAAESKAAEYKDSWLRSQADFQNYKKRLERDNELMYTSMKGDIIKKVLPALDDLERALQNRRAEDPWADGIRSEERRVGKECRS